jgi:hypothetical protein
MVVGVSRWYGTQKKIMSKQLLKHCMALANQRNDAKGMQDPCLCGGTVFSSRRTSYEIF